MNESTIKKILKALESGNIEEAKTLLNIEYMRSVAKAPTKTVKLVNAVKKIINNSFNDFRPVLQKVNIDKNGKQFICDSFIFVRFNNYIAELEALPQAQPGEGIDAERIIPHYYPFSLNTPSEKDLLIYQNIGKFKKLFKDTPVFIFGQFFSAPLLEKLRGVLPSLSKYCSEERKGAYLQSEEAKAVIMPLRMKDDAEREKSVQATEEFYKTITT